MVSIDRNSKTPIYKQIYDDINLRIAEGEYSLGSMLPSESKLCAIYNVERATIRHALSLMVEEGKIAKIPGLGANVTDPNARNDGCKNKTLLFLLPRGSNNMELIGEPFNAKLMEVLDHQCAEQGYALLYKPYSQTDTVDSLIRACNPCGVFIMSVLPANLFKSFHQKGIPIVLVNQNHPLHPSVCVDNRGGARMAAEYLLDLGHRKIGFIGVSTNRQAINSRFNGFNEILEQNSVTMKPDWIVHGDWSMASGRTAMRQIMSGKELPTALFVANDAMAIGAVMEAQESGISVPNDISIVGFDDVEQSSYIRPSLTTVAVDFQTMARAACMLMINIIESTNDLNVNIYVPLRLIERESAMSVDSVKVSSAG